MKNLHLFGLTIIILVTAAFINTPVFFRGLSLMTRIEVIILITFLITIALVTIGRLYRKEPKLSNELSSFLGIGLFITSSAIFFGNTHYFYHGVTLPLPFWHRVSFYTLPAIALESAVVTGFQYMIDTIKKLSNREKSWITRLFFFYTLITMAINFMAIGKLISVGLHISIARIVIISTVSIAIGVIIKKK